MRETIRRGANLFVTYPGYSDYRHVPVVGKGVTFQLPGSPDRWGMIATTDFLARAFTWQGPGAGALRGLALALRNALGIDDARAA